MSTIQRCAWVSPDQVYIDYHDNEWGIPLYDERQLFEFLLLEGLQAGLSWITILLKRPALRAAFADFDPEKLAKFTDRDLQLCLQNPKIIRNKLKVAAMRQNAQAYLELRRQNMSLSEYLWDFVAHKPQINHWDKLADVPTETDISRRMSKDLKKRGFKFIGPTICYAFMQAVGMVMDHTTDCYRYLELSSQ